MVRNVPRYLDVLLAVCMEKRIRTDSSKVQALGYPPWSAILCGTISSERVFREFPSLWGADFMQ